MYLPVWKMKLKVKNFDILDKKEYPAWFSYVLLKEQLSFVLTRYIKQSFRDNDVLLPYCTVLKT